MLSLVENPIRTETRKTIDASPFSPSHAYDKRTLQWEEFHSRGVKMNSSPSEPGDEAGLGQPGSGL